MNLQCINIIKSDVDLGGILTLIALLLAFFAYRWSVIRYFQSWKSLFISFKKDLDSQKSWLSTSYPHFSYKEAYDPGKIIFPLSFTSLPQIISKGLAELPNIPNDFINQLSLFNERIVAFNSLLENIKQVVTANPVLTQKMEYRLLDMGLDDEAVSFEQFEINLEKLIKKDSQNEEKEVYYLAKNIQSLNITIHTKLISTPDKLDRLHGLYLKIDSQVEKIINTFDKNIPFYIKINWLVPVILILLSALLY